LFLIRLLPCDPDWEDRNIGSWTNPLEPDEDLPRAHGVAQSNVVRSLAIMTAPLVSEIPVIAERVLVRRGTSRWNERCPNSEGGLKPTNAADATLLN
jgi:hypothetical protein